MYDDEQRGWLAGRDYEMAAERRGSDHAQAPPDSAPSDPESETYADAVERAGVTELPDRDALLGDLGGGPSLALLDKLVRDGRFEDDNPPGAPWRGSPR